MKILILLALIFWPLQTPERCGQCGMDLSKYGKTVYEIRWTDGTLTRTCGVQCGLTQQIKHREKFKSSTAKDYWSGQSLDARTGFYVFSSSLVPDMAPGFIAFRYREGAEKFQKQSGGQVTDFNAALVLWEKWRSKR